MIWQLMKRDRPWRTGVVISIVVAVLTVIASVWMDLPPHVSSRDAFRSGLAIFLMAETLMIVLPGFAVYAARDFYEAALPLDGRDIWLSRLLALLSVVWLPVPIGIIGGLPPLTLLVGASLITFVILCGKCYRIRQLGTPRGLRDNAIRAILIVPACFAIFGRGLRSVHWPVMPPAWSVLTASGLGSIVLFRYGWQSVPQSFSIAPPDLGGSARREPGNPPKPVLTPVLRSVYISWSMLLLFGFVVSSMAYGNFSVAILAVIPLGSISTRCRWLLALPVSRRKLFALVAAAPTVAVSIGAIASALLGRANPQSLQVRLGEFAAELASAYLALFLLELPHWHRLSQLRMWIKWVPFGVAFFTMPLFSTRHVPEFASAWPLLLLFPVATYRLAEKAFIEQEYPRPLIAANQYRSS